jgi:hypothetical protein
MGEQRPQLVHLPPGICSTAGDEAVELAEACGLVLDPWQRGHVRAMLAQRRDDEVLRWAAMESASHSCRSGTDANPAWSIVSSESCRAVSRCLR